VTWIPLYKRIAYAILFKEPYDGRLLNQRLDEKKNSTGRKETLVEAIGVLQTGRSIYACLTAAPPPPPTHRKDISGSYAKNYQKTILNTEYAELMVETALTTQGPVFNNTAEYPVVKILLNATLSDRTRTQSLQPLTWISSLERISTNLDT